MCYYRQIQLAKPSFPTSIGSPTETMGGPMWNPGGPMWNPGGPMWNPGGPMWNPGGPIGSIPPQINQQYLSNILTQYQKPQGQPPTEMVNIYQQLKSNPALLRRVSALHPKTLQQAIQTMQSDTHDRSDFDRSLSPFCYFTWSLVFTFTDIYLIWPATNMFGLVVGYCYPFLIPCAIPDFQIAFTLC